MLLLVYCHWNFSMTWSLRSTQPLTEMSTSNISWQGKGSQCKRLTTLPTTFTCRLSWNLRASTSWNPQGLFRLALGLLYFHLFCLFISSMSQYLDCWHILNWLCPVYIPIDASITIIILLIHLLHLLNAASCFLQMWQQFLLGLIQCTACILQQFRRARLWFTCASI